MKVTNNYTIRFMIVVGCLVILDLIIKAFVVSHFFPTEVVDVVKGVITIGNIQTFALAFGFRGELFWITIVTIIFQILVLLLAIRIQQRPVNKGLKYGTVMIIGAWMGTYIDRLLFSGGNLGYRSTDYLLVNPIEGFHSLTSVLSVAGWIVFIISMIVSFRDVKMIFKPNSP